MIVNYTYSNSFKYQKILELVSKKSKFVFSFNRYSPWSLDLIPPFPTPNTTLSEFIGFLPISQLYPVITTSDSQNPNSFLVNNLLYLKIDSTYNSISSNKCSKLCFESSLDHNLLPQPSWRTMGLHMSTSVDIPFTSFVTSIDTSIPLIMVYTHNAPPRTKENNVTETVRIILPISASL